MADTKVYSSQIIKKAQAKSLGFDYLVSDVFTVSIAAGQCSVVEESARLLALAIAAGSTSPYLQATP